MKLGDMELDFNEFFRYVFGGFILIIVIALIFTEKVKSAYNFLGGKELGGSILLILFIFAIGAGFYGLYKSVFSEGIIDNIHFHKPEFFLFHQKGRCVFQYLVNNLNVIPELRLTAFRLIRDTKFDSEVRKVFYLRHSEIHVLYEIVFGCLIGSILLLFKNSLPLFLIFLSVGFVAFIGALLLDRNLCENECVYMRNLNVAEVSDSLKKANLTKKV